VRHPEDTPNVYHHIPKCIFLHLLDGAEAEQFDRKDYETEQEAADDLSSACVAWARREAKLPDLNGAAR